MKFKELPLKESFLVELEKNTDNRGFFSRLFCDNEFKTICDFQISQVNNAFSYDKATLRGIHLQKEPFSEQKLVRCINGEIWDLIIDLRIDSKTFGKWHGELLSEKNRKMLFIPKGFGHGYITMKKNSEIIYLVSEKYNPDFEIGIKWNDPFFNIRWPMMPKVLSQKDASYPNFSSSLLN
tara:strand:- start:346 stop:885 length:540 start_codon:yes stop_codon:yes gene_type:complete